MAFQYDVFISYAHEDLDWATKVNDLLGKASASQYKTFFDKASLRTGDNWETNIQRALENAQHLVVLWSDHAKGSDWVTRELWSFYGWARPDSDKDRRLICLNLQGMNTAAKAFQQSNRPGIQAVYPDISKVDVAEWKGVVQEIDDGFNPGKRPLSVPVVVLTLDQAALESMGAERLASVKADFGFEKSDLVERYGMERAGWHPYSSDASIDAILDKVRKSINLALQDYRVDWQLPGPTFWTDIQEANAFVENEFRTGVLSVLIIDPVAIYHGDVFQRLMLFLDSFESQQTAIVMLPPFGVSSEVLRVRAALHKQGTPYFNDYFRPVVPPKRRILAQCSWNVIDTEELQRHILMAAAGRYGATRAGAVRHPYVVIAIHEDAMRCDQKSRAEAVDEFSGWIEMED